MTDTAKYKRLVIVDPQLKDRNGHSYRYAKGLTTELGLPTVIITHKHFQAGDDSSLGVLPMLSIEQYDNGAFKKSYRPTFFDRATHFKDRVFSRLQKNNDIWDGNSPIGRLVNIGVSVFNFIWFFPAFLNQLLILTIGKGSSAHRDVAATEFKVAFEKVDLRETDLLVMQTMLWPTFESLLELKIQANKNYGCDALFIVHEDWRIYNTLYVRFTPAKLVNRVLQSLPFGRSKIVSTNRALSEYCREWCDYRPQVVKEINFPLVEGAPKRHIDTNEVKKILVPGVYRADKNFESLEQMLGDISEDLGCIEVCIHESVLARLKLPFLANVTYSTYSNVSGAYEWLEFLSFHHVLLIPYGDEYRHRISGIVHEARLLNIPVVCNSSIADAELLANPAFTFGEAGVGLVGALQAGLSVGTTDYIFKPETNLTVSTAIFDDAGWILGEQKPIAVQVKPAWTRCGTSVVLDAQMDCLVEQGFFVIEVYLKTEPWKASPEQVEFLYKVMRAGREYSGGMAVRILFKNVTIQRMLPYAYKVFRKAIPAFFKRENIHGTWCDPDRALVNFLSRNNVELAVVNHIFNYDFARKYIPANRFICETHDIQINQLLLRRPELSSRYEPELQYEMGLLGNFDAVVNLNQKEHKVISQNIGEKAHFIPPPILQRPLKSRYKTLSELVTCESTYEFADALPDQLDLLIIADAHPANIESVKWFIENVFSKLNIEVSLGLVGTVSNYLNWNDPLFERVYGLGFVDDLANIHEFARVTVLPDIAGEGIPIKTNDAIARGAPFVATKYALRAFNSNDLLSAGIIGASTAEELASQIEVLLSDENSLERAVANIGELRQTYSLKHYLDRWENITGLSEKNKIRPHQLGGQNGPRAVGLAEPL